MSRPRVRVGGRFAGKVAGVEFFEGGVDVVGVEPDARHDPAVGVDLEDAEQLDAERLRSLIIARDGIRVSARRSPRIAMTVDAIFLSPNSMAPACSRSAASRPYWIPAFTHPTAIVDANVVGQRSPLRHPSRGPQSTS